MGDSSTGSPRGERGPDEAFCRNCGEIISERAEICPECGVRQRDPPRSSIDAVLDDLLSGGNPFVAAVLSALVPGLGQLYNRELEKGIAFIVGSFLALLSALVFVGFVLYPAVWIYSIYDAYTVAERQVAPGDAEAVAAETVE
jgi:TM2 domain-containing membrane protein YozV